MRLNSNFVLFLVIVRDRWVARGAYQTIYSSWHPNCINFHSNYEKLQKHVNSTLNYSNLLNHNWMCSILLHLTVSLSWPSGQNVCFRCVQSQMFDSRVTSQIFSPKVAWGLQCIRSAIRLRIQFGNYTNRDFLKNHVFDIPTCKRTLVCWVFYTFFLFYPELNYLVKIVSSLNSTPNIV